MAESGFKRKIKIKGKKKEKKALQILKRKWISTTNSPIEKLLYKLKNTGLYGKTLQNDKKTQEHKNGEY